ncbi:Protein phosphatase 1 regulatory subunit 14D [Aix galericulata]|nr:Protein phosphatase 1 regulatory subunit 14D [Aix galericulata]
MARNSGTQPRVTFQTPEKPGEESSHRKLGKLTIKYNRKDLQRWLDLEEWVDAQLQELYQYPEILHECSSPTEDFITELLSRLKGLRRITNPQKKLPHP